MTTRQPKQPWLARLPPVSARDLDAAGILDPQLRDSYERCRVLNAQYGKTYYLATLLLPPNRRPYVHALYGFARYADEIVDALSSTLTEQQKADLAALPRDVKIQRQENQNIEHQMRIHARVDEVVKDKATAEALKPWYMHRCKRPCYDDEYLPAFNLPNVHLVDTHGKGVTEINERGVVFEGKEYPVDVLIYATGFEVQVTGIYNDIRGVGGRELNDKYKDGMRTVLGIHSEGYPNLFIMGGYQASFQFNLTFMLQTQGQHIADCVSYVRERNHTTIDAKYDTEQWWVDEVIRHRGKTNRNKECTPGYYNFEGEDNRRQDGNYNGGFLQYFTHMNELKKDWEKNFNFG